MYRVERAVWHRWHYILKAPTFYQFTPTVYQFTPIVYQLTLTVYQFTPTVYQFTPTVYQFTPNVYHFTHTVYQFTPTVYQFTPTVYQFTLTVYQFTTTFYQFPPINPNLDGPIPKYSQSSVPLISHNFSGFVSSVRPGIETRRQPMTLTNFVIVLIVILPLFVEALTCHWPVSLSDSGE
jgi:hypothetical protein